MVEKKNISRHVCTCTRALYFVPSVNSSDIGLLTRTPIELFGIMSRRTEAMSAGHVELSSASGTVITDYYIMDFWPV